MISLRVMLISSFLLSSFVFSIDNVISFFSFCLTCFACIAYYILLFLLSLDLCVYDATFVVLGAAICAHAFTLFVIIALIFFISFSILFILSSVLSHIYSSLTSVSICNSFKCVIMSHSFYVTYYLLIFIIVPRILIISLAISMMISMIDLCVMQDAFSYSDVSHIIICPELFSSFFLGGHTSISSSFLSFMFIIVLVLCFTLIEGFCLISGNVLVLMMLAMNARMVG